MSLYCVVCLQHFHQLFVECNCRLKVQCCITLEWMDPCWFLQAGKHGRLHPVIAVGVVLQLLTLSSSMSATIMDLHWAMWGAMLQS